MAQTLRTTVALVGDLLAGEPGERIHMAAIAERVGRDRAGVDRAKNVLVKAGAICEMPDPAMDGMTGRPRTVAYMTGEQAAAWNKDAGASVAAAAGIALIAAPVNSKAAAALVKQRLAREGARLRFGVWSDGALAIEGLARKQLTLPADDAIGLAVTLSSLPEGALDKLIASPLKPVFTLQVEGRDYPLTTEQTADLVAYIEQLPARQLRKPDHRVHVLRDED